MKDGRAKLAAAVVGYGLGFFLSKGLRGAFTRAAAPPMMAREWHPKEPGHSGDGGLTVKERPPQGKKQEKLKRPSMWNVLFMNDDYTDMGFVEGVLKRHFNRNAEDAHRVMMEVHTKGSAIANVTPLTFEVAETKQGVVMDEGKKVGHAFRVELQAV